MAKGSVIQRMTGRTPDIPAGDFSNRAALALRLLPAHVPRRMSDIVPASMAPAELEKFLHAKIPLTAAMGIRVVQTGPHRLILEAPLAPNVNHLGSVFGGALHTLPTLACYAALWTLLVEHRVDGHVVVQESHARYRQPVGGTFRAGCDRPPPVLAANFIAELRRFRKARMVLESVVDGANGQPAVEFSGSFVAVV